MAYVDTDLVLGLSDLGQWTEADHSEPAWVCGGQIAPPGTPGSFAAVFVIVFALFSEIPMSVGPTRVRSIPP